MIHYVIGDGKGHYIRRDPSTNRHVPIYGLAYATKYEDRAKAERVHDSTLAKEHRKAFKVIEVDDLDCMNGGDYRQSDCAASGQERNQPQANETVRQYNQRLSRTDRIKASCEGNDAPTKCYGDLLEDVGGMLNKYTAELKRRYDDACQKLSDVDLEISDLHHYIELQPANAYEGWLLYKALRQRLLRRRAIKDELFVIGHIGDCRLRDSDLYDMQCRIEGMENRKFVPRKLDLLFAQ